MHIGDEVLSLDQDPGLRGGRRVLLPGGWHHLYVPSVDRPVVLGPGGVFVLDVRHRSTMPLGLQPDRPSTVG